MVETNPHVISKLTTSHSSAEQLSDEVDFPHSGLIKALNQLSRGNIPVKTSSGFNITQASSGNVVSVSAGQILKDGVLQTATSVTNFTTGDFSFTTDNSYYLLVVNSSNTVVLRTPTAANRVADFSLGDTILAMIEISSATSWGSRKIQFFTTDKESNGISIAYSNGGVFTESGKLTGDSNSLDIVSSITDADINITPNGNGKIVLDGLNWPIADGSANQVLKTDGLGQLSFVTPTDSISAVEGESTLDLTGTVTVQSDLKLSVTSNDVIIENTFLDKDIFFKGNVGGTPTNIAQVDVSAKALIIPDKIYANTIQLGYGTGPAKLQVYNAGDDLEIYAAGTTGGNVKIIDITAGTDGAEANRIVAISGNLTISKDLTVDTDTLYVDSTNQKVGIETNVPDHELHIVGTTKTGGFITGLTEKISAPSPLDSYDIQVSDHTIFAALDPIGNNLTLNLPQGDTTQVGLEYRIIITTSGTGSLNLDVQSGDSLSDSTLSPLITPYQLAGSGSPPYSAGDVLIILQKSGTEWVLFKTN